MNPFRSRRYGRFFLLLPLLILEVLYLKMENHTTIVQRDGRQIHAPINSQNYSRSLFHQNAIRLERLRKKFSPFLMIESFYQPESNKTMVYFCSMSCNGWGDRLRGIMSVYMLALLTRRRFMIDINRPCPMSQVLQPNLVNWTFIPPSQNRNKSRTRLTVRTRHSRLKKVMLQNISNNDFVSLWEPYDDIWITKNQYYVTAELQNPWINKSWLLGRLSMNYATQHHLFPLMFELLFKPTNVLVKGVDEVLRRPYQQLLCFHVRMGKNPSLPKDVTFRRRKDLGSRMVQFLHQNQDTFALKVSLIFATSDSDQATNQILKYFPNKSITIPGSIIHVNFIMMGKQKRDVLV